MEGYYFDEEKRASRGIGKDFLILSLAISIVFSLAVGFAAFKYITYGNLSPFQRFYFGQFVKSFINQPRSSAKGNYRILVYQAIDPQTKKKDLFLCLENHLSAKTDDDGNVLFDGNKNPQFFIKEDVPYEKGSFTFYPDKIEHGRAHNFFAQSVYKADFLEFFYFPAGGAAFSFVFVLTGLCAFRKKRLKKVLEGKYIRGTQMLSPAQYAREMKKEADGLGIDILTVE